MLRSWLQRKERGALALPHPISYEERGVRPFPRARGLGDLFILTANFKHPQQSGFEKGGKPEQLYQFDVRIRRISRLGAAAAKRIDEEWEMLNPSFPRGLPRDQYVYAPNGKVRAGVYPPQATEELRRGR